MDRGCPRGQGVLPLWGWDEVVVGGGREGIGRFSWAADAQYADV